MSHLTTTSGVEELWSQFAAPLRAFIARRVRDEHDANDIAQQVFLKIHERIGTLRDRTKLESWLYRIARNAIVDHYRARRPTEPVPEALPAEHGDAENELARRLRPCVKTMVEGLDEKYRDAVRLTEYEGLTQKEMAGRLGISLTAAKSRVQRGREQIKKALLACCHFEFDRYGNVLEYQCRRACGCCEEAASR